MEKITIRITICKECKFAEKELSKAGGLSERSPMLTGGCLSSDAPIHDFVLGTKHCQILNKFGNCIFFKRYAGNSNKGGE